MMKATSSMRSIVRAHIDIVVAFLVAKLSSFFVTTQSLEPLFFLSTEQSGQAILVLFPCERKTFSALINIIYLLLLSLRLDDRLLTLKFLTFDLPPLLIGFL